MNINTHGMRGMLYEQSGGLDRIIEMCSSVAL